MLRIVGVLSFLTTVATISPDSISPVPSLPLSASAIPSFPRSNPPADFNQVDDGDGTEVLDFLPLENPYVNSSLDESIDVENEDITLEECRCVTFPCGILNYSVNHKGVFKIYLESRMDRTCYDRYAEYVGFSNYDEFSLDKYEKTGDMDAAYNEVLDYLFGYVDGIYGLAKYFGLIDMTLTMQWAARATGSISLVSSIWMLYDQLTTKTSGNNGRNTGSIILILMSICDIFNQVYWILGPIMTPKKEWVPGSFGNQITCNIQGFIIMTTGTAGCMYTTLLAIYFLLSVKYEWKEPRFRRPMNRWFFIGFPLSFSFLSSIWGLYTDVYGNYFDDTVGCYPGGVLKYVNAAIIVICFITIVSSMVRLWLFIRATSERSQRYAGANSNNNQRSNEAAQVGFMFCAFFILGYFPYLFIIYEQLTRGWMSDWNKILHVTFVPLQGFWNMLGYRYRKDRKIFTTWWDCIKNKFSNCKCSNSNNSE